MVRSPSFPSGLEMGFTKRVEDEVLEGGKLSEARNSPSPLNNEARTTIDPLIGEGSSPSTLPEDTNWVGDSGDTTRVPPRAAVRASTVEGGEKQAIDFVSVEEEPKIEISDLMINSVQ
ncbi:hypothetical protein U1Q18_039890 [Sarracenia purpurea var. burkii]